jgi:hypothetical protein
MKEWSKLTRAVCLVLVSTFALVRPGTARQPQDRAGLRSDSLSLIVQMDRASYDLMDDATIRVFLVNNSVVTSVYLYPLLTWGRVNLSLLVTPRHGGLDRFVEKESIFLVPPTSAQELLKLSPGHIFGVALKSSLSDIGIRTPGTYTLRVQYKSPLSPLNTFGVPAWTSDHGTIESNVVSISVR